MKPTQHKAHKSSAFTLLEVIMALSLSGLVLTGMMTLFVSFVQVWNGNDGYQHFIQEVEGCTRFLQQKLNQPSPLNPKNKFSLQKLNLTGLNFTLNTYSLAAQVPHPWSIIANATNNQGPCVLAITHHKNKLYLLWQMRQFEDNHFSDNLTEKNTVDTHKMLLCSILNNLQYAFLNEKTSKWTILSDGDLPLYLQNSKAKKHPDALILQFKKDDWEETRIVDLRKTLPKDFQNQKLKKHED